MLLVLVAGLLLAIGGYAVQCAVSNERTSTLRCNGNEKSTYDGQWVEAKIAVRAEDRCQLTLRDCHLYGEMTSVQATGHAEVRLEGCSLRTAIRAWDHARVTAVDSTISGGARATGQARIELEGGEIRDGDPQTIWAGDDAVVQVKGTKVEGRVDTADNGRILGMESR